MKIAASFLAAACFFAASVAAYNESAGAVNENKARIMAAF